MIALRTWLLQVPWENSFTAFPCLRCIKRRPNATSSFSELARILVLLAILEKLRHLLMMWNSDSSAGKVKSWSVTKSKEFKMITVVSRAKYFHHRKTVTNTLTRPVSRNFITRNATINISVISSSVITF